MEAISELNQRFGRSGPITFDRGPGGLTRAVLTGAGGRAAVLVHGAHVTEFQPVGERPVLWMSGRSWFEPGKPIRGGVPVCWPWFSGDGPAADSPNHGFARLVEWRVVSVGLLDDGRATISLALNQDSIDSRLKAWWPEQFELTFTVTVGRELTMELTTRNTGQAAFTITEALHTYFAVSDIRRVRVLGLEGAEYLDTVGPETMRRQGDEPIQFTGETDRDYLDNETECVLVDEPWGRRIAIAKSGSRSTVVWNPWIAKSARMPDFGDDEWPGMVCIETANVRRQNAVMIAPGGRHSIAARIRCL